MKMKAKFVALWLAAVLLGGCAGQIVNRVVRGETIRGSGQVSSETREVSDFNAVSIQSMGEFFIDQTGTESLTIQADDNLLPYIVTEVYGGTLTISTKDGVVFTDTKNLAFDIRAAELNQVELAGAGSVEVSNLDTDSWTARLPGAGTFRVSGRVDKQTVEIEGAGSYNAENLESKEAIIRSSGAGMAVVQVSDKLDVTIDGLGSVQYIGDPAVTETINGLGSVTKQ